MSGYGQKSNYMAVASYYYNARPMCFPALMYTNYFCLFICLFCCSVQRLLSDQWFLCVSSFMSNWKKSYRLQWQTERCSLCFSKSVSWWPNFLRRLWYPWFHAPVEDILRYTLPGSPEVAVSPLNEHRKYVMSIEFSLLQNLLQIP